LAVLVAAVASPACHRADSILLVEVAGDETLPVAQLEATLTVDGQTKMLAVPPSPRTITLPASFSVELDDSLTGPVFVHIDALDAGGGLLGSGDTTQDHINVGGQTIITVTLGGVTLLGGADAGGAP
jgi:hypothetical protein